MLVSPAERPPFNSIGTVSSVPETLGSDFLMFSPTLGKVGVQRKAIPDLVASIHDGRVAREIIDMKGLDIGIWMIEGKCQWSTDGQLLQTRTPYSWTQHQGILWSLSLEGYWVMMAQSQDDSMRLLSALEKWVMKTEHLSLKRRPTPHSSLGTLSETDRQAHILMGFPGIGYKTAMAILASLGCMPLILDPAVDLTQVPGVGTKTVEAMKKMLGNGDKG